MLKTFTLTNIKEEVISETEGKMAFEIVDEADVTRIVWGKTTLGADGLPESISANKKREHPLIQCLFNSQVNETIKIEFTQYNDIFERDDQEVDSIDVDELMNEMQKKLLRMGELLKFQE